MLILAQTPGREGLNRCNGRVCSALQLRPRRAVGGSAYRGSMGAVDYFHGTNADSAEAIMAGGFSDRDYFDDQMYLRDGYLGRGVYLTRNVSNALFYGYTIVRVRLEPSTRMLTGLESPVDMPVIDSLRREFGRELLTSEQPRKAIPPRKQLTHRELAELIKFHYQRCLGTPWRSDRWPPQRERHYRATRSLASLLKRYGYDGYGDEWDEIGLLIFAVDRAHPVELLGTFTGAFIDSIWQEHPQLDWKEFQDLIHPSGPPSADR